MDFGKQGLYDPFFRRQGNAHLNGLVGDQLPRSVSGYRLEIHTRIAGRLPEEGECGDGLNQKKEYKFFIAI